MRPTFGIVPMALSGLLALTGAACAKGHTKVPERNGPYLGIQPGVRDIAPGKIDVKGKGALRVLTWVGFQMLGGGRVFVQTTEAPVYTLMPSASDEVVLELTDTRLQSRNDARKLETGWFPTAVLWVKADQTKNVTRVTIKLREIVGYDLRQEGNYLMLDFRPPMQPIVAPGGPAAAPSAGDAPPAAAPSAGDAPAAAEAVPAAPPPAEPAGGVPPPAEAPPVDPGMPPPAEAPPVDPGVPPPAEPASAPGP